MQQDAASSGIEVRAAVLEIDADDDTLEAGERGDAQDDDDDAIEDGDDDGGRRGRLTSRKRRGAGARAFAALARPGAAG